MGMQSLSRPMPWTGNAQSIYDALYFTNVQSWQGAKKLFFGGFNWSKLRLSYKKNIERLTVKSDDFCLRSLFYNFKLKNFTLQLEIKTFLRGMELV